MGALLEVVLPVFLVIGFGVIAQRFLRMPDSTFEGLMGFAQGFAFPMLLFRGISRLDLADTFNPPMLTAFFIGVTVGFFAGLLGARFLFRRDWEDCVAIAFGTAFSNGGLLGLPITERAYGVEALSYNFAIIAFHAPFVYLLGTTAMEIVRAGGRGVGETVFSVVKGMAKNPMLIGIVLGALANVSGVRVPDALASAVDLIAAAAIPTALFALGGILALYKPEGDLRLVGWIVLVSLIVHPLTVLGLGTVFDLDQGPMRSAVLMAAMAPGVNTYVFANMYGVAKRVSATAVLAGTAVSILTVWGWLTILS